MDDPLPSPIPLPQTENATTEFKRRLPRSRRHLRTLVAFANGAGGTLYVGVADDGEVVGVPHPRRTVRRLTAQLRTRVRPPLRVHVEVLRAGADGKRPVVCARVCPSRSGPHETRLANDRWQGYVREGAHTVPVGARDLDRIVHPARSGLPRDPRARAALRRVSAVRSTTAAEVELALNLSRRRTRRILTDLVRSGLVVAHEEPRVTRYVATPQGRRRAELMSGRGVRNE